MRPVSIIFLIISVILVIVGLLTCSIAMLQSKRQGVDLYDTTIVNGQSEAEYDFSNDTVSKLQIEVGDCDVDIIFGADVSKVQMNNFSSAGYICEVDNRALVVEDTVNIFNITDIIENGKIRFKGFRYFLRDRKLTVGDKSLKIYVSEKFDLRVIDIKVKNGNVNIAGYVNNTDYIINIENGNFIASDLVTESTLTANVGKGTVRLNHVTARTISTSTVEGNIDAIISAKEITADAKKGNINIESESDLSKYNFVLKAPVSTITLEELVKAGNYIANDALLTNFIHADAEAGSVKVKTYIPSIAPITPDDGTDTTADTAKTE